MATVSSATRVALIAELNTNLSNWGIRLSLSQMNALVAHIESIINSNNSTVLTDVTSDLGIWSEPAHGRNT